MSDKLREAAPSERDLFEAWMRGRGLVHAIGWSAKFCEYELAETQARWITWQAARRAPQPVAREPLTDEQCDAAAKKLAECMDYPWGHMPEQGRKHMREYARSVVAAAIGISEGDSHA